MSTQDSDGLYRTISFSQEGVWGYPASHLIAMQYVTAKEPTDKIDSEINFYFSSERVRIQGKSLRLLWDEMVMKLPEDPIRAGSQKTTAGEYRIETIEIPPISI